MVWKKKYGRSCRNRGVLVLMSNVDLRCVALHGTPSLVLRGLGWAVERVRCVAKSSGFQAASVGSEPSYWGGSGAAKALLRYCPTTSARFLGSG